MNSQLFGQKQEPNAAPWTRIEILKNKDNVAVLRAARAGKTNSLQGSTSIFLPHHGGRSAQKAQISDGSSMSCSILIPTKDPQRQSTDFWYTKRSKSLHS